MIERIDSNKIQDFFEKSASTQPNAAGRPPSNKEDVSIQVDYAALIDKAMQPSETDASAIQHARELLLSGRLETIENIREAAQNIVKFGI